MEQESDASLSYSTLKRAGYKLALAAHVIFIILALTGTVILLTVLLFEELF